MSAEEEAVLDLQVRDDLFALENHILAMWDDVLAMHDDVMDEAGSIRTIALSPEAAITVNASRSVEAGGYPPINPQGTLMTYGRVTLDVVFRAHYLPSADFHRKPRQAVKRHWVERNLRVIERVEREMITLIPTTEEIRRFVLRGHRSEDMGGGRRHYVTGTNLQVVVWPWPKERVEHHASRRTPDPEAGIYRRIYKELTGAREMN